MIGYVKSNGYKDFKGFSWGLIVSEPTEIALQSVQGIRDFNLLLGALTLLGVIVISIFIARNIANPLIVLRNKTEKVAQGDLREEFNIKRKDELGQLATSMNSMIYNLKHMIEETLHTSKEIDIQSNSLNTASIEIKKGSEQIAVTMQEMAVGSEDQASSSTSISNSVQNLDKLIGKANYEGKILADSSQVVFKASNEGIQEMKKSINQMAIINEQVNNSVEKVKNLDIKSQEISKLVQVINDISDQTNLLALNAAIEAARAGEAGRGFSVVSEEIRNLSEQVSKSAIEISEIIRNMQHESKLVTESLDSTYDQVQKGTLQITVSGEYFNNISSEITQMIDKIENVTDSLDNIESNSKEISSGVQNIASISEENSASTEETAASVQQQYSSVENLSENANLLSGLSAKLNDMVKKFKI
ncbi:methyl-accepting chemotaxis protein [Anaeromonas frigoriresistens]